VLTLVQIALGVFTISTFKELVVVTGHLFVAASMLGILVMLLASTRQQTSTFAPAGSRQREMECTT